MLNAHSKLSLSLPNSAPLLDLALAVAEGLAAFKERILAFQTSAHEGSKGALKLASLVEGRQYVATAICGFY